MIDSRHLFLPGLEAGSLRSGASTGPFRESPPPGLQRSFLPGTAEWTDLTLTSSGKGTNPLPEGSSLLT